jgi:hypothetical protein
MNLFDDEPVKEVEKVEKYKPPSISPFDFINAINFSKEELIVDEWSEKQYNAFIVNRGLSYGADTVMAANEMNVRHTVPAKAQFRFLINTIRPRKRFNKWIKAEKLEELEVVKQYYGYSTVKAQEALRILTPEQIRTIKTHLYTGGKSK